MALIGDKFVFIHNPHTGGTSLRSQLTGVSLYHDHTRSIDIRVKDKPRFGVCRHPYAWIVSRYEYIRRHPDHYDYDKTATITQYLHWYVSKMIEEKFLPNSDYYCTQWDYLSECEELIHFENPDRFKIISEITGVEIDSKVKLNSSERKAALSFSDMHLIRTVFAIDFEKFGYE